MTCSKALGALGLISVRGLDHPLTGREFLSNKVGSNQTGNSIIIILCEDDQSDSRAGGQKRQFLETSRGRGAGGGRFCFLRRFTKSRTGPEMDLGQGDSQRSWMVWSECCLRYGKICVRFTKRTSTSDTNIKTKPCSSILPRIPFNWTQPRSSRTTGLPSTRSWLSGSSTGAGSRWKMPRKLWGTHTWSEWYSTW